jgi:hypothetical protein
VLGILHVSHVSRQRNYAHNRESAGATRHMTPPTL